MRRFRRSSISLVCCLVLLSASATLAQDWPQWRGPNRDARATGFEAPSNWPEQLTEKWKIAVGVGVASPSLVGDKLYVFARQDGDEILRCLNAANGEEIWKDAHPAEAIRGPASSFDGPRCSPTVIDGKVVTLGAQGVLSCYDADSGKLLWRNEENVGNVPRFATSSSPIVLAGLAVTQFGADEDGGLVAYDLGSGEEKWKWTGSGAAYGSPVSMDVGGTEAVVSPMSAKLVVIAAADGGVLFEFPYRQGRYNSATPMVSDNRLILAGPERGITAYEVTRQDDEVNAEEIWKNTDNSLGFNTPAVQNGKAYGISAMNSLFCLSIESGQTLWNSPLGEASAAPERRREQRQPREREARPRDENRQPGEERARGRRGRRGRGGRGGYGSVVDAGSTLFALVPNGQLTVFAPGDDFQQVASYKVAEQGAYAYPVPSKHGLFIKDQDSIGLWTP